jgi:hypothetical protein
MAKELSDAKFRHRMVESILIAAVENGLIEPDGKTTEQLEEAFSEYLASVIDASGPFFAIHDHSEELIKRARQEFRKGNYHFAALFYATWVEHWVNWYVRCLAVRTRRMTDVEIREMIREVNLRGKLGWLNNALGGKPFSNKHRNAIQRLADHRNAFIHFKYPEFDMDDFDTVPTKL